MKRIFCLLTILFCTSFAFNASAQEERDSPRRGEGISVFLERNKRPGRAYYKEFLELNKKLLKGKEELRLGVKYTGMPPVMISECSSDLWQLRSTNTMSPRATVPCQTILLAVEVPLVTKKVWSAPKLRAASASASRIGPVWSSREPSSGTEIDRSLRKVFSP